MKRRNFLKSVLGVICGASILSPIKLLKTQQMIILPDVKYTVPMDGYYHITVSSLIKNKIISQTRFYEKGTLIFHSDYKYEKIWRLK